MVGTCYHWENGIHRFMLFFDDDITYDSDYGNHPEDQNDVEVRIKENTPRLHNQVVFRDVADKARVTLHYEKILLQDLNYNLF